MRLLHEDSSPLRIWLGMFLISSPIMGIVIFALGMAFPPGYWQLAFHAHWILLGAVASGAWIATRSTRAEIYRRKELKEAAVNLPGEHPRLGAYRSWPYHSRWSATMPVRPGAEPSVELTGRGLAPIDKDVALWLDGIAPQMDELMAAVLMKLEPEAPAEWIASKPGLSPRRVRLCNPGEVKILFDAEPEPDSGESPVARFSRDLELLEVYWTP